MHVRSLVVRVLRLHPARPRFRWRGLSPIAGSEQSSKRERKERKLFRHNDVQPREPPLCLPRVVGLLYNVAVLCCKEPWRLSDTGRAQQTLLRWYAEGKKVRGLSNSLSSETVNGDVTANERDRVLLQHTTKNIHM